MDAHALDDALDWCASILGPIQADLDHTRDHPGARTGARRLHTASGEFFLKLHADPDYWASEVHAYERWTPAFAPHAPRLIAARDQPPLALIVTVLPGAVMEGQTLDADLERRAWRDAGCALAGLHAHATGAFFGPCRRDGSCAATPITDACAHVLADLDDWTERGLRVGCLSADELALANAARAEVDAFAGEPPVPCHRDYGPANWLIAPAGAWSGVIDFEFARWDVRISDFTRYPDWNWMTRPDLIDAFFDGYGRMLTPAERRQRWIGHVQYALAAIVWGTDSDYLGFAAEGRIALARLAERQ